MKKEIPYLHVVRVVACLMVVCLHSLPSSLFPVSGFDAYFKIGVIYATRPCVPLFLMLTGILLMPYRGTAADVIPFYKKRIPRILFPLLVWGVVYSVLPYLIGMESLFDVGKNLLLLPLTPPPAIGGILWYLYVLIGLYLIIPFINPEVFSHRRWMRIFIVLWLAAAVVLFIQSYKKSLLGVIGLMKFHALWYFSGYMGYMILGKYLHDSKKKLIIGRGKFVTVSTLLYLAAMVMIALGNKYTKFNFIEWLSLPSIAMTTIAFFLIKRYSINTGTKLYRWIKELSALSFGIYLSHMVIYRTLTIHIYNLSTAPWIQVLVMILTFTGAWLLTKLIAKLPSSKFIIG